MIEFAFDLNGHKEDGTIEYTVHGETHRLPRGRVVQVYDTNTGNGPFRYYVVLVTPQGSHYIHKLKPLPIPVGEA
jgi:hypothetical protein